MMQDNAPPVLPPVIPETRLRDALEALSRSEAPTLPLVDPQTGRVLAVLSRPDPPRLGGIATPLGVYLHDGVSSGGAGFWGLFLTGVTMSGLILLAQGLAHGLAHEATTHWVGLSRWEMHLPLGLQLWLSAISSWLPLPFVFLLLRLLPMSGTHAAEHQVVHCIERSERLVPELRPGYAPRPPALRDEPVRRLYTLFLLTFLAVFCAAQAGGWPLLDAVSLAAMLAAPVTLLLWRRVGGCDSAVVRDAPRHECPDRGGDPCRRAGALAPSAADRMGADDATLYVRPSPLGDGDWGNSCWAILLSSVS